MRLYPRIYAKILEFEKSNKRLSQGFSECAELYRQRRQQELKERNKANQPLITNEEYLQTLQHLCTTNNLEKVTEVLSELKRDYGEHVCWIYTVAGKKHHLLHTAASMLNTSLLTKLIREFDVSIYEQCPTFGPLLFALIGANWKHSVFTMLGSGINTIHSDEGQNSRMELVLLQFILKHHEENVAHPEKRPENFNPNFLVQQSNIQTPLDVTYYLSVLPYAVGFSSEAVVLFLVHYLKRLLISPESAEGKASYSPSENKELIHAALNLDSAVDCDYLKNTLH